MKQLHGSQIRGIIELSRDIWDEPGESTDLLYLAQGACRVGAAAAGRSGDVVAAAVDRRLAAARRRIHGADGDIGRTGDLDARVSGSIERGARRAVGFGM